MVTKVKPFIEFKPISCGYAVMSYNVEVGQIAFSDDGFYQFWPKNRPGYWPSYILRAIADEVDSLNGPWEKELMLAMRNKELD